MHMELTNDSEAMRIQRVRSLTQFFGQGLWEGSLAEMRQDSASDTLDPGPDA